jgi:uncharacterized integral membrane protein
MSDGDVHRADDIGRGRRDRDVRDGRALGVREVSVLALVALFIVFAALNFDDAHVNLIADTVTLPLIVVIGGCFGLGLFFGWLLNRRRVRRARKE